MRVYLAGPEVFLPDARAVLDAKIALTREAGLVPVCPGDLAIPETPTPHAKGLAISRIDEQLMVSAEAIIANLTPFRGIHADPGTCYELGFMCARGARAYAYTNVAEDVFARTVAHFGGPGRIVCDAAGEQRAPDGMSVEDFGMMDNVMLDGGIENRGGRVIVRSVPADRLYRDLDGFKECLRLLAAEVRG